MLIYFCDIDGCAIIVTLIVYLSVHSIGNIDQNVYSGINSFLHKNAQTMQVKKLSLQCFRQKDAKSWKRALIVDERANFQKQKLIERQESTRIQSQLQNRFTNFFGNNLVYRRIRKLSRVEVREKTSAEQCYSTDLTFYSLFMAESDLNTSDFLWFGAVQK